MKSSRRWYEWNRGMFQLLLVNVSMVLQRKLAILMVIQQTKANENISILVNVHTTCYMVMQVLYKNTQKAQPSSIGLEDYETVWWNQSEQVKITHQLSSS